MSAEGVFTRSEVKKHNTADSIWVIHEDKVKFIESLISVVAVVFPINLPCFKLSLFGSSPTYFI